LTNARLRTLAAALAPAYVRVSGTWANNTYFAETDPPPPAPPPGFNGVLTSKQWRGVVDFANAVDAQIVTSFAISMGTRDKTGVWSPEQARRFVAYTRSLGGRIAAAEFMNEPNLAAMGGAPPDYDPAAYGRDFKLFRAFAEAAAPDMLILGPGSVGESTGDWALSYGGAPVLRTRDLLIASGLGVDAFSYHHRPPRTRHSRSSGSGAPTRRSRSIVVFGTSSSREHPSGSLRPPTPRVAATRGAAPFSTAFAISTSSGASPSRR
jgi:hypothetical protein